MPRWARRIVTERSRTVACIARLGRLYGAPLAHALGFRRGKTPAKSSLSELFGAPDVAALKDALA